MLTSANPPRRAGRRAGLWLQYAAVKIGPAPLAPQPAPAKRASWSGASNERRRIRACGLHAARAKGSRLGSALRDLTPCPTVDPNPPTQRALPRLRPRPRSGPEGLSRARRQPRLAAASRRFAVANTRVDRCARLRRCAFMSFDGPIRPFGPDVRVEAHEKHEPTAVRTDTDFPLDKPNPIRARGRSWSVPNMRSERPRACGE
jgi:hypothetical protein